MSASRHTNTSMDFNPATFRYWQTIAQSVYEVLYHRNPYARYYAEGILNEAFSKGFDIMEGDKEHGRNDEILRDNKFNDTMEKATKGITSSRWGCYSVLGMFQVKGENSEPELYWLDWDKISELDIKAFTREITKLKYFPPIYSAQGYSDTDTVDVIDLTKVKLLGNYSKESGRYRSIYEPIFDDLVGLTNISQQIVVKQIRIGSGIRVANVPWEIYANEATRNEIKDDLDNMGINSMFTMPLVEDG